MKLHISTPLVKLFLVIGFCIILMLVIHSRVTRKSGSFGKFSKDFIWQLMSTGNSAPANQTVYKHNVDGCVNPSVSKGEQITCKAMQDLFGKPFHSARPNFLKSPITGRNLEIDCFNPELNVGAEYNGIQHYTFTPKFHKTFQDFRNGQYRDYIKRDLCEKNGTRLIQIPYTIPHHKIKQYIAANLR